MKKISFDQAVNEIHHQLLKSTEEYVSAVYALVSQKKVEITDEVIFIIEENGTETTLFKEQAIEEISDLLDEKEDIEVVAKVYQKLKAGNVKVEDNKHISWHR